MSRELTSLVMNTSAGKPRRLDASLNQIEQRKQLREQLLKVLENEGALKQKLRPYITVKYLKQRRQEKSNELLSGISRVVEYAEKLRVSQQRASQILEEESECGASLDRMFAAKIVSDKDEMIGNFERTLKTLKDTYLDSLAKMKSDHAEEVRLINENHCKSMRQINAQIQRLDALSSTEFSMNDSLMNNQVLKIECADRHELARFQEMMDEKLKAIQADQRAFEEACKVKSYNHDPAKRFSTSSVTAKAESDLRRLNELSSNNARIDELEATCQSLNHELKLAKAKSHISRFENARLIRDKLDEYYRLSKEIKRRRENAREDLKKLVLISSEAFQRLQSLKVKAEAILWLVKNCRRLETSEESSKPASMDLVFKQDLKVRELLALGMSPADTAEELESELSQHVNPVWCKFARVRFIDIESVKLSNRDLILENRQLRHLLNSHSAGSL